MLWLLTPMSRGESWPVVPLNTYTEGPQIAVPVTNLASHAQLGRREQRRCTALGPPVQVGAVKGADLQILRERVRSIGGESGGVPQIHYGLFWGR
jgi:hypothetical protein